MTPEQIDRVFGRGRLKMVTGEHVEVFREAVRPGERRRYTKRFLNTAQGDFAHWTEREWRILARLIGHGISCVPDVVQFDRGSVAGVQLVQTYDAGVTVDQWATLLPLARNGRVYRHAFEDCAHWWALAHHCLIALREIHQLQLVHLDIKGDNVCIPVGPVDFDPDAPGRRLHPMFGQLALIDFAFALVSREALATPLPIGWQRDYDYQSPRLLKALADGRMGDLTATRELDWRCDMYSLAAMLKRYLPDDDTVHRPERTTGWTPERHEAAQGLIQALREHHDRDAPDVHPHAALIDATGRRLRESDLALSLAFGWTFARDADVAPVGASPLTPMTRLAPPIRMLVPPRDRTSDSRTAPDADGDAIVPLVIPSRSAADATIPRRGGIPRAALVGALAAAVALIAVAMPMLFPDAARTALDRARAWAEAARPRAHSVTSAANSAPPAAEAAAPGAPSGETAAPPPRLPDANAAHATRSPGGSAPDASPRPPAAASLAKVQSPLYKAPSAAADKRPPPAPLPSSAQSPKPAGATAPQRQGVASSANRAAAAQTHRAPPSSTGTSSGAAPAAAPVAPRAEPAMPASQAAQPLPAPGPTVSAPASSPPAMASAPRAEEARPAPAPPSASSAAPPAPTMAAREYVPPAGTERRADPGVFSRLFNLAGAMPAPIEDRRPQPPAPSRQPNAAESPMATAPAFAKPVPQAAALPDSAPSARPQPALGETVTSSSEPRASQPLAIAPLAAAEPPPTAPPQRAVGPLALAPAPGAVGPLMAPRAALPVPAIRDLSDEDNLPDGEREEGYATQARRALTLSVPQMAAQAQAEIHRVLWLAANAQDPAQERAVVEAAQSIRLGDDASVAAQDVARSEARRLNAEALHAWWTRQDAAQAFDLQLKAFGANPYDPEIAGNLASLHLKPGRMQPETARQLALVALALRSPRHRAGRFEDWNTYAIASALSGRDADARNALFVGVAVARNVDGSCRAALGALANYGERLREPVEAMIYRIHTQGRAYESPYCTWPPTRPGMRLR